MRRNKEFLWIFKTRKDFRHKMRNSFIVSMGEKFYFLFGVRLP